MTMTDAWWERLDHVTQPTPDGFEQTDSGLTARASLSALLHIGKGLSEMAADQALLRRQLASQAGLLTPAATVQPMVGTCPTPTASFAIDAGGPAQGRIWDVRRLLVGGAKPTTTAAGSAYAFITSAAVGMFADYPLSDWLDYAATLPLNGFYSAGEATLRYPEHVIVVITGGTAGQQYGVGARVVDRMETPTTRTTESVGA